MKDSIKNFYDLNAWKEAHKLSLDIYQITKSFPKEEQFGITSQLRRAASSVAANIAEGFGRYHFKDKVRFYYQARGSVSETQSFLFLSKDLGFIKEIECEELIAKAHGVNQLINGLIKSIEKLD